MDVSRAVGWMLKAASGTTVCIDRAAAGELMSEISRLMYHYHPNPDGADNRCELCGNEPRAVWDAELRRYISQPIVHAGDCPGDRLLAALDAALADP